VTSKALQHDHRGCERSVSNPPSRGLPVQTITLIEVGSAIVLLGAVVLHRQTRPRPSRLVVLAGLLEPGASYPLIKLRSGPDQRDARHRHRRDRIGGHRPAQCRVGAQATHPLGSAVAFSLYNWALSQVSTVAAGVSLTLIPVFGVAFSAALLSEPVTWATVAAAVAVIVGVVASVEPEPPPMPFSAQWVSRDGRSAARPG
jgi:EamA-like transporter family